MKARKEPAGILEQWLQLTREEGGAIQSAAWPAVRQIQARKAGLKQALGQTADKYAERGARSLDSLRAEAGRIVSLLTRNGELLAAQLRRARARQELLDQTKRNLQKVQQSYVRSHPPAAWHSYS